MRFIFFLFTLSFFHSHGQNLIKGTVKDSLQNPVSLVNVRLYNKKDNSLIVFKQSNTVGQFELTCPDIQEKNFILKASCVGFVPYFVELNFDITTSPLIHNITLKNEIIVMKEVVIKADFADVTEKNDTISYNLKKLLNGSEQKLKDVLKKLPGISIDDNGKIKFRGRKIDDLLIEGDELYGDQHQLATDNIKSEMIEKIELLKDFKNLAAIEGFNNQNRTALNIRIKESYKNTFKGDIDLEYGFKKRYRGHNNLYNFASKAKLNLISEINNTNTVAFTVNDYLELKRGISDEIIAETNSNSMTVDENVPTFLFASDDVNTKDIKFYSFNFSDKLSKKSKVSGFSILNNIKQTEFLRSKQIFFSEEEIVIDKNSNLEGGLLFNSNKIQFESKPNAKNYFNYILSLNHNRENQNGNIKNMFSGFQTNFDEDKVNSGFNLGQLFTHKIKLNKNYLFEYSLFTNLTTFKKNLNLQSNEAFLNLNFNNSYSIVQTSSGNTNSLGVSSKLTILNSLGTFVFNAGSSANSESFNNTLGEINSAYDSRISFVKNSNYTSVNFSKKKTHNFNYSLGFRLEQVMFEYDFKKDTNLNFLPSAAISYEFSKKANLSLSYKRDFSNVTIDKIIPEMYIEDYRTITRRGNLFYNAYLPKNTLSLNGAYNDYQQNFTSFFGLVYTNKLQEVGFNTSNTNLVSSKQFDMIYLDDSSYLFFIIEKKIKSIPWSTRFEMLQSYSKRESYIDDISTDFKTTQNKADLEFVSYFKSNDFNINFGLVYTINNSVNTSSNNKNSLSTTTTYLQINGLIFNDKFNWKLTAKHIQFSSSSSLQKNIFECNPSLQYQLKNWNFTLKGINVLNIRENNVRLRVNNQNSFFEETLFSSLSGFVNCGVSFSF
ncbi:hypothetical protein [Flavobacterium sp. FPG59]|uniref:hypothetical protein n=1 Tax=Flavobacterium sp. FPG59 TaxID=1929267 RepID=UPI000A3B4E7A|nr:hypothetical protein [Flavobacterium sp. FPG59]OUD36579.1 hypothetical protein FPG59_05570 [Flavobacterium sp. FPG59]